MTISPLPIRGASPPSGPLRKIALEEHFQHPATQSRNLAGEVDLAAEAAVNGVDPEWLAVAHQRLMDFDTIRIEAMDQSGVDATILSLTAPGIQAISDAQRAQDVARQVNDFLAERIAAHPKRLLGFASVALHDPDAAARELERTVTQLGFKGVMVNGYSQIGPADGIAYLDEDWCAPFCAAAAELGVPIYIHPRASHEQRIFQGHKELIGATWGFAPETATHALRMVYSGLFDRFPNLTVILGHLGETLPFFAWRIQHCFEYNPGDKRVTKRLQDYLADNFYITTSGNFSAQALTCALLTVGADRILFSADYPYENMDEAARFIETCPIAEGDRRKIAHGNAERLFGLNRVRPAIPT